MFALRDDEELPNVLYVDDERNNRLVFAHAFANEFSVSTCETAVEALERLRELPVQILVADLRMPGMTGAELCRRVRELYPAIVRYVLTAWADDDALAGAVTDGAVERVITKPWDRDALGRLFNQALGRKSLLLAR